MHLNPKNGLLLQNKSLDMDELLWCHDMHYQGGHSHPLAGLVSRPISQTIELFKTQCRDEKDNAAMPAGKLHWPVSGSNQYWHRSPWPQDPLASTEVAFWTSLATLQSGLVNLKTEIQEHQDHQVYGHEIKPQWPVTQRNYDEAVDIWPQGSINRLTFCMKKAFSNT